jgi:hypothetical protein
VNRQIHHEGKRIKRRGQPIVQLRSILIRLRRMERVVSAPPQQFPDIFFTHGVDDVLRPAGELGEIERIAIEGHNPGIALSCFEVLNAAALQDQE